MDENSVVQYPKPSPDDEYEVIELESNVFGVSERMSDAILEYIQKLYEHSRIEELEHKIIDLRKALEALWGIARGMRIADNDPKQYEMHILMNDCDTLDEFITAIKEADDGNR